MPYLDCWVVLSEEAIIYLAVLIGTLHKSCHGRRRFRVGRLDHDRAVGDRPKVLLRIRGRRVLHSLGALGSLHVPTIVGA